jgi:hypothetical protein
VDKQAPTVGLTSETCRVNKLSGRKYVSQESFYAILLKLKKTQCNWAVLMESHDIRDKGISYVRHNNRFRKEGRSSLNVNELYGLETLSTGHGVMPAIRAH